MFIFFKSSNVKEAEVNIDLQSGFFYTFYAQCDEIKQLTQEIKDNVEVIKSLHAKILGAPTADESKPLSFYYLSKKINYILKFVKKM